MVPAAAVVVEVLEAVIVSKQRDEVQSLLDELGADVDIEEDGVSLGDEPVTVSDSDLDSVDISSTSVSVVKEFEPGEDTPADFTNEYLLDDGSRVSVTVKKRPRCPNCQYVPLRDDDPVSLTGECTECGTKVCPQCRNDCAACGTILCSGCTMGHGSVDETYCPICRQDVQDEVEHHRRLEKEQQRHEQEMSVAELQMQMEKQKKELEMKAQQKKFDNSTELKRLKKELLETKKELEMKIEKHDQEMENKRFKMIEDRANEVREGGNDV